MDDELQSVSDQFLSWIEDVKIKHSLDPRNPHEFHILIKNKWIILPTNKMRSQKPFTSEIYKHFGKWIKFETGEWLSISEQIHKEAKFDGYAESEKDVMTYIFMEHICNQTTITKDKEDLCDDMEGRFLYDDGEYLVMRSTAVSHILQDMPCKADSGSLSLILTKNGLKTSGTHVTNMLGSQMRVWYFNREEILKRRGEL